MPKPKFPHFFILKQKDEERLLKLQKSKRKVSVGSIFMKGVNVILDEIKQESSK